MGEKKKQASAYREPLILIAFVILGAIIGMVMGEKASFLYPIGQIWLNLLFVLLVPLLFFSISSSIANISDTKSVGKLLGFEHAMKSGIGTCGIQVGDLRSDCSHCRKFYVCSIGHLWCRYFRSVRRW